jgi:hypothetical protein
MLSILLSEDKTKEGVSLILILCEYWGFNHLDAFFSNYTQSHLLKHGYIGYFESAFDLADNFPCQCHLFSEFLDLRSWLQKEVSDHHWVYEGAATTSYSLPKTGIH